VANIVAKGIDLSAHNGAVDFNKLKQDNNIDFVILRAGFGKVSTQKDKMFETYYKGCKDNNIPIGAYWFSYCLNEADAILEAKACMECIKDKQFEYPIYFDMEIKEQCALPKQKCIDIVTAFCNEMEKNNYWCGIYSMDSFFRNNLNDDIQKRYAVWTARVENIKPTYCSTYQMWQYSWKGKFSGIKADTDCNYCYVDYPNLIKKNKKNGYNQTTTTDIVTNDSSTISIINNNKIDKNNYYNAPLNMEYVTDIKKNVITTYKYSKAKDKKLSKHFTVKEFAAINKSTGKLYSDEVKIHNRLIQLLEKIYVDFNCSKIIINSGYRTKELDLCVGGSGQGQHCLGQACDFTAYGKDGKIIPAKDICIYLEELGNVYGIGFISNFSVHIDTRLKSKEWIGTEIIKGCPNIYLIGYKSFKDYFNKNKI
jgi:lysozyme